ncbi:MAG TPA: hypothetical protein VFH55_04935 [Nitrospiria bacterium]|nr:hypothetical protein [Nitrospiria bacterium]
MANKLTPRFETAKVAGADWISIDIGLWNGKKSFNTMSLMIYNQGPPGRWFPPVVSSEELENVSQCAKQLWNKYACHGCSGMGCADCGKTGWKEYMLWEGEGRKINSENFAVL